MDMPSVATTVNFEFLGELREIPFRTHSDALLAVLVRKHSSADVNLLNDFIALLHAPEFESTELTFGNTTDVYRHLAEQWQNSIQQRAFTKTYSRLPVPQVVVELVADYLARESPSIFDPEYTLWAGPSHNALYNMAFVHRSWTNAAQCQLRRRIIARGEREIYDLRRKPQLGPWVREFFYNPYGCSLKDDLHQFSSAFVEVLRACPNIRDLRYLSFISEYSKPSSLDEVFNELSNLSGLERLSFESPESWNVSPYLRSFLQVLPRLTSLKTLALVDLTDGFPHLDHSEQIPLDEIELPGPTLTHLSYSATYIHDRYLLPLIFRLSSGLTTLEIPDPKFFTKLSSPLDIQAVDTVLSGITDFRFYTFSDPSYFDILLKCVKLRRLTIVVPVKAFQTPILTIPNTVEHLWLHYKYLHSTDEDQDELILYTIKRLPNLRTLTITTSRSLDHNDGMYPFMPLELFSSAELPAYCSEKWIELAIKSDFSLPILEYW